MALPPIDDPFALDGDNERLPGEPLPAPMWPGVDIPAAPPLALSAVPTDLAAPVPLLPFPGAAQPVQPVVPALPATAPPPAPEQPAIAQPTAPEPFPRPSLTDVQARIQPAPTTPEPERAPEAAARQAEFVAETAATQATREADYLRSFADRMREVGESDRIAREQVASQVERIDAQVQQDQDEIRALTREQGKLSPDARVGVLVAGGLQALKALIGAGRADMSMIDRIVQQDSEQKAAALQGARERADISAGARRTELGRLNELDYLRQTATATTWEQIAADLDADAAAAKDSAAKLQLATAADRARASAIQARNEAMRLAADQEIERTKKAMELTVLGAKAAGAVPREEAEIRKLEAEGRKAEAEALRAQRRAMGGGGPKSTGRTIESQLRDMPPKERAEIEQRGVRSAFSGNFLVNDDGTFAKANTPAEAAELREQIAASASVNDMINKIITLRNEYGFEWSKLNSDARQVMVSTKAKLLATANKAMKLGAMDGGTLEILEDLLGGDPAGWYDTTASLENARQMTGGDLNRVLRSKSSFKGTLALPKDRPVERSLEDISRPLKTPYNPVAGTVIDTETRLAALDEERQRIVQEFSAGGATKYGAAAGLDPDQSLRAATEVAVDRATKRVNEEHRQIMARMEADRTKAREQGDDARVATITKAMDEQRRFADAAGQWAAKQRKKLESLPFFTTQKSKEASKELGRVIESDIYLP